MVAPRMRRVLAVVFMVCLWNISGAHAGFLDDFLGKFKSQAGENSLETTISGLKEALSVGTGNAVGFLSKTDGYFGNAAVKILMPEKIQNVADVLKKMGFENQVDEFVMSMNRAAEAAAPSAKSFFIDAIKEMTFDDAKQILNGGDTAATDYLKSKTHDKIYDAFQPTVVESLNQVGGTAAYNKMMQTFSSVPFMNAQSLDLNHYVTEKALTGMFYMVGEEEKKIRTDPAARVTELLKDVFGK